MSKAGKGVYRCNPDGSLSRVDMMGSPYTVAECLDTPVISPVELADVYEDTADYLHTYGWKQLALGTHGHPRCVRGALASVMMRGIRDNISLTAPERMRAGDRYNVANNVLAARVDCLSVPFWNDNVAKDQQEVEDTLRLFAKELRMLTDEVS